MIYLEWLIVILHILAATAASWHALLYKRDSRAAFGWIAVCMLFPLVGSMLYYFFGVNRVENRARLLSGKSVSDKKGSGKKLARRFVDFERGGELPGLRYLSDGSVAVDSGLERASFAITGQELVGGNRVEPLFNGDQAFPRMLAAIDNANHHIYLMTYIFETNATGKSFIESLRRAVDRGVEVRVMIDGMGEKYSIPTASRLLRRAGIDVCRFNAPRLLPPMLSVNLRNHRKILVVDNEVGFTGGINIGDRHLIDPPAVKNPVADIHFALCGPVVSQLSDVFEATWLMASGRTIASAATENNIQAGDGQCRVIVDGPDEYLDRLSLVIQAAVSSAQQSIRIMMPYFLPTGALIGCLQSAVLLGVRVQIILPEKSNLPYVHRATRNMLWELLYYKVEVYYQPPPFAHSKLFLIDSHYALLGSANIDPRSLRLNYELDIEVYDHNLVARLTKYFDETAAVSTPVTMDQVDGRSLSVRTRDALCWLFSPYL